MKTIIKMALLGAMLSAPLMPIPALSAVPPAIPELGIDADELASFKLQIMQLRSASTGMSIQEYEERRNDIITGYIDKRREYYRGLRATETITSEASAKRPSLWKGRNHSGDKPISTNAGAFAGWEVVDYQAKVRRQNQSGKSQYRVEVAPDRSSLTLITNAVSGSQDDFSEGKAWILAEAIVVFALQDIIVERLANADAAALALY